MQAEERFTDAILTCLFGDTAIVCQKAGLSISTSDSDVYVLCDPRFSTARIYRSVPIAIRETKGGMYLHSDPKDPTFSETVSKVFNETVRPETLRREKKHLRAMAADLKTPEGRKRFGREFLNEIADLDVRKMVGNTGALFYSRQRENLQKHSEENAPIFVGLPVGSRGLEIFSESGDIEIYLTAGRGREKTLSYLTARTVTGDVSVIGTRSAEDTPARVQDVTLATTKADIRVADIFAHYLSARTLSGDCELRGLACDDLSLTALRSGDALLEHVNGKRINIVKKSGDARLSEIKVKALTADIDHADLAGSGVGAERIRLNASDGDIDLSIVGDTKAVIQSGRGDIRIDLDNAYKGFTAKIEERMHGGEALTTEVAYGRYRRTFTGDQKIACNEKKSSFEIRGGDRLTLTGSIPTTRRET